MIEIDDSKVWMWEFEMLRVYGETVNNLSLNRLSPPHAVKGSHVYHIVGLRHVCIRMPSLKSFTSTDMWTIHIHGIDRRKGLV